MRVMDPFPVDPEPLREGSIMIYHRLGNDGDVKERLSGKEGSKKATSFHWTACWAVSMEGVAVPVVQLNGLFSLFKRQSHRKRIFFSSSSSSPPLPQEIIEMKPSDLDTNLNSNSNTIPDTKKK